MITFFSPSIIFAKYRLKAIQDLNDSLFYTNLTYRGRDRLERESKNCQSPLFLNQR